MAKEDYKGIWIFAEQEFGVLHPTVLRWSPPKRTPNLLSAKAANTLLWSAVILAKSN